MPTKFDSRWRLSCQGCDFQSKTNTGSQASLIEEVQSLEFEEISRLKARQEALQKLTTGWLKQSTEGAAQSILPTASSEHIRMEAASLTGGAATGGFITDDGGNLITPHEAAARQVHWSQAAGQLGAVAGPGVQQAMAAVHAPAPPEVIPRRRLEISVFSKCRRCMAASRSGLLHKPSLQPLHGDSGSVMAGRARHQKHVPISSIMPLVQFTDACELGESAPHLPGDFKAPLGVAPDGRLCAGRLRFDVPGGPSFAALQHALPTISPTVVTCVQNAARRSDDVQHLVLDVVLANALRQPVTVTIGGAVAEDTPKPVADFETAWVPVPGTCGCVEVHLQGNDGMGAAVDIPEWPRPHQPAATDEACVLWQNAHWACVRLQVAGRGVASALASAKAFLEGPRLRNFHHRPTHITVHVSMPIQVHIPSDSWIAQDAVDAGTFSSLDDVWCCSQLVCPVHLPVQVQDSQQTGQAAPLDSHA